MRKRERMALEHAIDKARHAGPADAAVALRDAGVTCLDTGELEDAFAYFSQAMDIYVQMGDTQGGLEIFTGMAAVHRAALRFAEAATAYRAALELSIALDWKEGSDQLRLKIAEMNAADRAGIDVPQGLVVAAASAGAGQKWVYEIDESMMPVGSNHAPGPAIMRAWEVHDGELTGLIIANPDYGGARL